MKSILLSTIKTLIAHMLTVMVGTITGAVLYMIYNMCSTLVAGEGFAAFNLSFFIQGLFLCLPFVFAISPSFVAFYAIRNKNISFIPLIVFSSVFIASWIFIQPVIIRTGIQKADKSSYVIQREPLSKGYFRNVSDKYVLFYSSVNSSNIASGVCMDKSKTDSNVYTFRDIELKQSAATFTDSLIQGSIDIPPVTRLAISYIANYLGVITLECSNGFICWLLFSSLGLVLVSLIFLKNFSRWRFINVVIILSLSVTIILLNVNVLSMGKLYFATQRISSLFSFVPEQANFLLFLVNVFLTALFVVIGFIFASKNEDEASAVSGFGDSF